jgi:cytochrome b6-f complex iron-sulfur subunit
MGNWWVAPADRPKALTKQTLKALRREQPRGLSRRQLLRNALGTGAVLWTLEFLGGSIGFLWPNLASGLGAKIRLGTFDEIKALNPEVPFERGFPAYFQAAKTYAVLIDPSRTFSLGADPQGDGSGINGTGTETNVRTLYQRCPHLGCKPNFCDGSQWFECPCHGSRYDRLGIKVKELGPAPRSLDRWAAEVVVEAGQSTLYVDTSHLTLGPLPVSLGQPGLIAAAGPLCL